MSRRTPPLRLAPLLLLLVVADPSTAGPRPQQPPEAPAPGAFALQPRTPEPLDQARGEAIDLGPAALTTERGPLFPLRRVVERLGGELSGEDGSLVLIVAGTRVVAGAGNPVAIVGQEIVELSQPPLAGEPPGAGLLVPLDFLQATWGELQTLDFDWSPEAGRLTARRRVAAIQPVVVDVVHLQGLTTVVLRFAERFEYDLVESGRAIEVRPRRDRLQPPVPEPRVSDALVADVRVSPDRVRIELAPGTSAEGYVLEEPFRLVFDVVRREDARAEAEEAPELERPSRPAGLRTIVIDPGHGGGESGAVGPGGEQEKDLTLELARALRARLVERLPVRVVLTRDEDASLPLDTRSAIANQHQADLFVSIHLNSSLGTLARGAETYFLSMAASDARAAEVAAAENLGAGAGDDPLHDLQLILWDLAQSYHLAASQRVASLIQQELNTTLGLRDRGVKQAPFRVLMGAAMPAVLVELGFLSNPEEEARLRDPSYRAELVEALVRAIGSYRAEVEKQAAESEAAPGEAPPGPDGPAEPAQ
ncbi:MAG TPA: N-acetylmuramoyl-L-alanine amidase [Thermoanaerobaculia bacterium]|nr:N-acetylmuramoyl-L-alanine amidase [Thermoanaerobaculia bacterium]